MVNRKKICLEKMVQQKKRNGKNNNIKHLISIKVPGSTGPLRFLVNDRDHISKVIGCALKNYAREERLPVLGFEATNFFLYCVDAEFYALNPLEPIGSFVGKNNFVLCQKNLPSPMTEPQQKLKSSKSNGFLKKLLNILSIN